MRLGVSTLIEWTCFNFIQEAFETALTSNSQSDLENERPLEDEVRNLGLILDRISRSVNRYGVWALPLTRRHSDTHPNIPEQCSQPESYSQSQFLEKIWILFSSTFRIIVTES